MQNTRIKYLFVQTKPKHSSWIAIKLSQADFLISAIRITVASAEINPSYFEAKPVLSFKSPRNITARSGDVQNSCLALRN